VGGGGGEPVRGGGIDGLGTRSVTVIQRWEGNLDKRQVDLQYIAQKLRTKTNISRSLSLEAFVAGPLNTTSDNRNMNTQSAGANLGRRQPQLGKSSRQVPVDGRGTRGYGLGPDMTAPHPSTGTQERMPAKQPQGPEERPSVSSLDSYDRSGSKGVPTARRYLSASMSSAVYAAIGGGDLVV